MISACELCIKIATEEALRKTQLEQAKLFSEKIISPILMGLTEIPKKYFIGYSYEKLHTVYREIGPWIEEMTLRGNPKKERYLENPIECEVRFNELTVEVLNEYLEEFGFKIEYEKEVFNYAIYSTRSVPQSTWIKKLYLSLLCPLDEE